MDETKIISQCILCPEKMRLHSEYTNPEKIRDQFIKMVFEKLLELYETDENITIERLFYSFDKETRKQNIQKICEGMLYEY